VFEKKCRVSLIFLNYFWDIREMVFALTVRHARMALAGVVIGTLTAVPTGIAISRKYQRW
jgi:ABC-type proline/glycine betaine transport system permease subunit